MKKDKEVIDSKVITLKGLDTLLPHDKELKMTLKDVDFQIIGLEDNITTIKVRYYIEAMDDYPNIAFHIKAIQYESNVLTDENWKEKKVSKSTTFLVESNLTAPKDYNYYIKLEAWRDGSLLKSWGKDLNLAPTKKIIKNVSEESVKFEVSNFVKDQSLAPKKSPASLSEEGGMPVAPGFEYIFSLLAVIGGLL